MQELADAVGRAGQNDLAAVLLRQHVAFEQERNEHGAEELHLAQIDDNARGRIVAQGASTISAAW